MPDAVTARAPVILAAKEIDVLVPVFSTDIVGGRIVIGHALAPDVELLALDGRRQAQFVAVEWSLRLKSNDGIQRECCHDDGK